MEPVNHGRRRTLGLLAGALAAPMLEPALAMGPTTSRAPSPGASPTIGLALGSGGARGLAHVLVLEILDEFGLQPSRMTGSSIGAVMAVLYAAGLSARQIHQAIDEIVYNRDAGWFESLFENIWRRWFEFLEPSMDGGLFEANGFMRHLAELTGVSRFDELRIPLQVVATDYWARRTAVIDSGELWSAIEASMALPGVLSPVVRQEQVLVDGGLTDPVPYELLIGSCDVVIAVDVLGTHTPDPDDVGDGPVRPSYFDNTFNTAQILQYSLLEEKLRRQRPDYLVRPQLRDIRVLDFHRYDDVRAQAEPAMAEFRAWLASRFGSRKQR